MTKSYQAKLISLAKEIGEISEIKFQLLNTKDNLEASQKMAARDNKINFLLGFILALEEDEKSN